MKNENFKKRLALALVPILSLTSVIGNVPILPTSVFAVTQDEVYIEEPMVIEEETLEVEEPAVIEEETLEVEEPAVIVEETEEVEEPAVIVEETEEVEEPEALLNEVPEDLQNLSVVNKDVLNAASTWTITNKKLTSKVEYKVGEADTFTLVESTTPSGLNFADIEEDDVLIKITTDRVQTLKTFTYTTDGEPVALEVNSSGEATIKNATALKITAINVEFEDKTTYAISWTGVTDGALTVDGESSPYAYVKDAAPPVVEFTADAGKVLTEFKVGGVNKLSKVVYTEDKISYTFEAKPTKAVAITAKFETTVCKIGSVDFASLASAIAYINANGSSATDYTIDILDNMDKAVALTLPAATKATSITLKSIKAGGEQVSVAISNTTLAIPTALILDNVVLTNSKGVNLTLSAKASALTVKAGGGIDKVVKVTTAAGKVITLENTTKFEITGNLSGKPNIILKGDLEIAGSVAIGELTYAAAKTVSFTKAATATATINKISTSGDVAAVLEAGILSLTIGEIDVDTAKNAGFVIKGRQYAVSTTDKTPVYKITGTVSIAEDKPIELSVYDKADTKYSNLATIDPTTAIITSVKTETTADMFKTSNKNGTKDYAFYKDGTALKFGNNFITLNAKVAEAEAAADVGTFIRLQDAFTYIDGKDNLTEVILKVSGDIPSHGALTFPEEDITIQSSENTKQYKVLFTGAVKLNGNLTLTDIELSNGNIKGIAFDLNGKNLILDTGSKVIFNTIKDTTKLTGTDVKTSELNIKDAADVSFLGNINAIGKVNIEDDVIFKGAVSNVAEIDIAAGKYAYFRGGAITNTLKYEAGSIINLPVNAKGGVTKNITIKATENAVTGIGKLKVNAVKDKLVPAVAATSTIPAVPEKITIETAAGAPEKVNPGAVIVKLVKNSDVLASSFVTDAKNNKLTTDQTLIATKAGTAIKIAAPKLTATAPEITGAGAFSENFVTIEEALAVVRKDTAERAYTLTITDNIVGADLTNIPLNVAVITAAKPAEGKLPFKIVTAKDIGLNGRLTIENLNILAAAKTIGTVITTGTGDTAKTTYTNAEKDLLLKNTSLTVKEGYIKDLTLQDDAIITFRKTGFVNVLNLQKGSTVGKISSVPVPKT